MARDFGRCPLCGLRGAAGEPCPTVGCSSSGVHLLPEALLRPREQHRPEVRNLVGTAIAARYLIAELAGRGNFGTVYRAVGLADLREVAVKVMTADANPAVLAQQLALFRQETEALAQLRHAHIVGYHGSGDHEGVPYLAMEYIAGGRSLSSEIQSRAEAGETFTPAEVQRIVGQTAAALACAHAHPRCIVHRDLKPCNLMLVEAADGLQVKVVDFGLAKYVAEQTRTALQAGTERYMAPEQYRLRGLGPATDLYALACIALELLTGERVFRGDIELVRERKRDPAYDPVAAYRELDIEFEPAVEAFFRKALAFEPVDRYASAGEFAAAFDRMAATVGGSSTRAPDLSGLPEPNDVEAIRAAQAAKERELRRREADLQAREREQQSRLSVAAAARRSDAVPAQPAALDDDRASGADEPRTEPFAGGAPLAAAVAWATAHRKHLAIAAVAAAVAGGLGLWTGTRSPAIASLRQQLGSGSATAAAGEPEVSDDAAIVDLGQRLVACFHPTAGYLRVAVAEPVERDGLGTLDGWVEFRGAISEARYRMDFTMAVRKVDGRLEMKVTPTADTALFPPSPNCLFRSWTEMD